MIELREVAHYVSDKISVSSLKTEEYITTDNMIPNRGGVVDCESLPQATRVTRYEHGDILVSNIRPYFKKIWFSDRISGCSNDVIVFRTNDENWNKKFLYYVLSQDAFFDFMMAGANGTKMPRGNKKTIPEFLIPDFDINKQIRIADILSAYDDLIKNNQKQIKLLEEAAQRLYKEWFVDLKFPGYEDTKITDGIPENWMKRPVTDLIEVKYGKDHKKLEDGNIPVYGSGGIMRKVKDIIYSGESVLIPRKGSLNNILYVKGSFWTIDTMFYTIPRKENVIKYVYLFLSGLDMSSFNTGAAVPSMTVNILEKIQVLSPPDEVLVAFNDLLEPIYNQIDLLKKKVELAEQARDCILPKLMSGELEVDDGQ